MFTLRQPVSVSGVGLHSGSFVRMNLLPEHDGRGIRFVRIDVSGAPVMRAADIDGNCPPFRTGLRSGTAEVHTVEHIFAAFSGLNISDCTVEIDGIEVPGMDGSAWNFVEALQGAGLVPVRRAVEPVLVRERIFIQDGGASLEALPGDGDLSIDYTLDYPGHPLAQGTFAFTLTPESFVNELARARTFAIRPEAERMRAAGLGKGANTENTVIVDGDKVIDTQLRYPNEPVRHKVLDLIGDLYVLNRPVHGRIIAHFSGHRTNRMLAMELFRRG